MSTDKSEVYQFSPNADAVLHNMYKKTFKNDLELVKDRTQAQI